MSLKHQGADVLVRMGLFVLLSGLFFSTFSAAHSLKSGFHIDEPVVVRYTYWNNLSLRQIERLAANTAQPALDQIIRTKIFVPLGQKTTFLIDRPEFFHRLMSLIWWVLPIGYFVLFFNHYSTKHRLLIILTMTLLLNSEFFRFYLAEARHYTAITSVFFTLVLILLVDKIPLGSVKYHFLIISLLTPFLHIISFLFYLCLVSYFFVTVYQTTPRSRKIELLLPTLLYSLFLVHVVSVYRYISRISAVWQHPSFGNLSVSYINHYLERTLDWIFYTSPIYPLLKSIPSFVSHNYLYFFLIVSPFVVMALIRQFRSPQKQTYKLLPLLLFNLFLVWPATIAATLYQSGMFTGERYTIAVLVFIYFIVGIILTETVWKLIANSKVKIIILISLITFSVLFLFVNIAPNITLRFDTPEDVLISDKKELLADPQVVFIDNTAAHDGSLLLLADINKLPIRAEYIRCSAGPFIRAGENFFNDWLRTNSINRSIYLFSPKQDYLNNEQIIWSFGNLVLYHLTLPISKEKLCTVTDNYVSEQSCLMRCFRGAGISPDNRSVLDAIPYIGIR